MTKRPNFGDALAKAEKALLAKRSAEKIAKPDSVPVARDERMTVNGVDVASVALLKDVDTRIRADFNEILENFQPTTAAVPKEVNKKVELVQADAVVNTLDEVTHFQFEQLVQLMQTRMNIMLKGELGGGKSTACRQAADLLKLEFSYIGQTIMPHDVIGVQSQLDGKYYETPFTRIYEKGGVIVFEELDSWSPNATLVLNSALANGYISLPDGRLVKRHDDCIIIACTNTWGNGPDATYVGRNRLDAAFLDRFGVKMVWSYDNDLERAAAGNDDVVDVVQLARANARRAGIKVAISPRSSIDISKMVAIGVKLIDAIRLNFGSSLDKDQLKTVLNGCEV